MYTNNSAAWDCRGSYRNSRKGISNAREARRFLLKKEIHRLYDAATQHYRALKAAKADSFQTLLTVILQQKLDERHG